MDIGVKEREGGGRGEKSSTTLAVFGMDMLGGCPRTRQPYLMEEGLFRRLRHQLEQPSPTIHLVHMRQSYGPCPGVPELVWHQPATRPTKLYTIDPTILLAANIQIVRLQAPARNVPIAATLIRPTRSLTKPMSGRPIPWATCCWTLSASRCQTAPGSCQGTYS